MSRASRPSGRDLTTVTELSNDMSDDQKREAIRDHFQKRAELLKQVYNLPYEVNWFLCFLTVVWMGGVLFLTLLYAHQLDLTYVTEDYSGSCENGFSEQMDISNPKFVDQFAKNIIF